MMRRVNLVEDEDTSEKNEQVVLNVNGKGVDPFMMKGQFNKKSLKQLLIRGRQYQFSQWTN